MAERLDFDEVGRSDLRPKLKRSLAFKGLMFGKDSVIADGDSMYGERDDRRRDADYDEDSVLKSRPLSNYEVKEEEEEDEHGQVFYQDKIEDSVKVSAESSEEDDDGIHMEDKEPDIGHSMGTSREEKVKHSSKNKASSSGKKMASVKGGAKRHRFSGNIYTT